MPVIIGAVIGTYMGGTLANNGDLTPWDSGNGDESWDFNSGKTWGYMAGGAIVGAASGYVGGAIAASEIPMANTLGIAGASLTNSIGTNIYTGGQTDISVSFGVASYNFGRNEWGYLGKSGNSTLENVGYGFGAIINAIDLYRYWTWDVLSREEQIAKLQKKYPDRKLSYDPTTTKDGYYDENTKVIYLGKKALNKNFGWAKSTINHEYKHYLDFLNQPELPPSIVDQSSYYSFLDTRAYLTELNNAGLNGLSYSQFNNLQLRLLNCANDAGITINNIPSYNFRLWILSIIKR